MALNFTSNQNNAPGSMPPPGTATPSQAQKDASAASDMLVDYNKKFAKGLPAKHRDKEIFETVSQLMMSQKSSSLLVGAPGTGKTKIVEDIARLIANKSPYTSALNDYTVYELPLSSLMAGTSYRGQLEEKVKEVIEYCEKEKVILFIDEIHQLVGSRSEYDGVAQMLKPAMARGSIKIIGATTTQESKNLLDDPAFNRRFNKVQVCELSIEQTQDIIDTLYLPKMASFYGIGFAQGMAGVIVNAAERSKTISCHRPDNAITLLDKICANTLLRRNYNIATCADENIRNTMSSTPLVINQKHVEDFSKDAGFMLPPNFDAVKSKIFYRDEAVDKAYAVLSDYAKMSALFPDKKPFTLEIKGDPKSGRTLLANEISRLVDEAPVYLDLRDYSDAPSLNRIIGSPAGYVGSDSKKEMPFDIVESNPRKVIILDNFDKCHRVIQDFFNSALDTALIKYADNRIVDISKCVVVKITESGRKSCGIGIMAKPQKDSASEIRLTALDEKEMADGAERMVSGMISVLKANHPKYAGLPDDIELTDEDRAALASPADMEAVARRIVRGLV